MTPATTIAALSSTVITGRRMKSSDRFMASPVGGASWRRARRRPLPARPRDAPARAALPDAAPRRAAPGRRLGRRALDHRGAGAQVLAAVDDDLLARLARR